MNLQLTATNRAVTSVMSPVYMKNSSLRIRPGICARPAFSRVPRACEMNQNEVTTFLEKGERLKAVADAEKRKVSRSSLH